MEEITEKTVLKYEARLICEEKSTATVKKYIRDIRAFQKWLKNGILNKESVLAYKKYLAARCKPAGVNTGSGTIRIFAARD